MINYLFLGVFQDLYNPIFSKNRYIFVPHGIIFISCLSNIFRDITDKQYITIDTTSDIIIDNFSIIIPDK